MVKINLKTKSGYRLTKINSENLINYRRTKYGYSKKSEQQLVKIHIKVLEKKEAIRHKEKLYEIKVYRQEHKRIRQKPIEVSIPEPEPEPEIEEQPYNYSTKNNVGYINRKSVDLFINDETTSGEHENNIREIKTVVNYYLIRNPLRQNYLRIHYIITIEGFQPDDIKDDDSSISTHIRLNIDDMLNEVDFIYYELSGLVKKDSSPQAIRIYQVDYVNYDFKSYVNSQ